MTEDEIRSLLREMREEPIPADSLARVRLGVEKRSGKRSGWKWVVPLALAATVVAGFLLLRLAKAPVRPVESAPIEVAQVQPPPETPVRAAPHSKRVRPEQVKAVPVLIRIETPDPDVVILFVN